MTYDPEAKAPLWDDFLERIMGGDKGLIHFLRRAIAWSLTGDTRYHQFFILFGSGANGKSTFLGTIRWLLGGYGLQTPTETLMVKRRDAIPNDVARLQGTRLISAIESGNSRWLNESLVKSMCGGDVLVARFLHGEFFEFRPQFKLFLATNHKPIIRGTDRAIWRRIRLVPFSVTIPEDEQDHLLPEKLKDEAPGILNWAMSALPDIDECFESTELVDAATQAYRDEQDVLGGFIGERCRCEPHVVGANKTLCTAYLDWCEENGERPLSRRNFSVALEERGFDSYSDREGKQWRGITLA